MRMYCVHAIKDENETVSCEFELDKPLTKVEVSFSIAIIQTDKG